MGSDSLRPAAVDLTGESLEGAAHDAQLAEDANATAMDEDCWHS